MSDSEVNQLQEKIMDEELREQTAKAEKERLAQELRAVLDESKESKVYACITVDRHT